MKHWLTNTQVDGVEVILTRASGAVEQLTVNDGKYATSAFLGESITLGLRPYTGGGDGTLAHVFSVIHDAGDNATTADGQEPTFAYTANEDAEVHFLDISTQTIAATYVVGANGLPAEYVNGVPVVAKVERCGWEQPAWALRGVATFELGATAGIEVRALGDDEVTEPKYYHPPEVLDPNSNADDCDATERDYMVAGFAHSPDERMLRGCRAKIPQVAECDASLVPGCQTIERPCATMSYEYVDQLPEERNFEVDLSILGTSSKSTCAMYVPGPVVASQDNEVATVDSLENYELTFTMELADDWSIAGWQSILHIGDSDFQRLPALWFHPSGGLHVRQSDSFCDSDSCNWGMTTTGVSFEAGQTYEINVVTANNEMTVYINGVEIGTATGDATYTATNAIVYVGDPWYAAAKVTLSDICLKEFAPMLVPTFMPTISPRPTAQPTLKPTRLPTAGPTLVPTHEPTPECALGTSTETFQNYELALTMELADVTDRQSILHIGSSEDQRLPRLWIDGGKLEVEQSSSASEYWGVEDLLPMFKAGVAYEIKVVVENNQMTVYVNGKNVGTASGSATYSTTNAAVTFGDAVSGVCLREIYLPSAAPTAAPTTPRPTPVPTLAPTACKAGYVPDCSSDGDCCPVDWIGDSHCDNEDQIWGCDLSCYDLDGIPDGGDCAPTPAPTTTLAPTSGPTSGPTPGPTPAPVPVEADATVEFLISSQLCLASVSATGTKLKKLIDPPKDGGSREYTLYKEENLLLAPPQPVPDGPEPYGKACTDNTNAVFREGDAVDLGFTLVEREPNCYGAGIYPWDDTAFTSQDGITGKVCNGYNDATPSPDHPIAIRVADGVGGVEKDGETYDVAGFTHTMTAGAPNPFAPFSKELSAEFTRAFDGAEILFVRHALVVGVIPEEVPQVWTTAVDTLIYSVLRDPPGGSSTATLVEGSTISTSMAIEGAHAATLEESRNEGGSGGIQGGIKIQASVFGLGTVWNGFGLGTKHGRDEQESASVTVDRGSSTHFDVGISFDIAISTSDSPYMPGQPSDVIIGGGANLRFISAIEIYATETPDSDPIELCLDGRQTVQFLPERITTYVMSVYEIEKTMERLGKAIQDIESGAMKIEDGKEDIDSADLQKQLLNWQTVLANYRATTVGSDLKSVAEQLEETLDDLHENFEDFHEDMDNDEPSELKEFVARGIKNLCRKGDLNSFTVARGNSKRNKKCVKRDSDVQNVVPASGIGDGGVTEEMEENAEGFSGHNFVEDEAGRLGGRVKQAANACAVATSLADPGNLHPLCKAYGDIGESVDLVETLLGVCNFATAGCCDPRIGPTDENGDPTPADDTCAEGSVCSSVDLFCKSGTVPGIGSSADGTVMSAFDFLTDTTKFLTFSGSTGVDFQWDVAEARGSDYSVETEGSFEDGWEYDGSFGFTVGRRLTDEYPSSSGAVAGYAYPVSGPVHAVSKKLLEVTPEALAEKRRRLMEEEAEEKRRQLMRKAPQKGLNMLAKATKSGLAAGTEADGGGGLGNPCRRRLQLGIQGCGAWSDGKTDSFSVSMSRAANKESAHTHTVAVSLKDGNAQDVFALQVAMDPVYGTPIFTTLGGRSSCVGETGTTRRDARVTIKEIRPLCARAGELCDNVFACECKDLPRGEDAIFSVVLENLSPWVTSVRPILRACHSFKDIELELVAECEDTDSDDVQEVYQYRTFMDEETGEVSVIHPTWDGATYSFMEDTVARGSEVHKASFDVSWTSEVRGCTYEDAENYNPLATIDDDECIFPLYGCKYKAAANYNPAATKNDGSCVFAMPRSLACDADLPEKAYSSACRIVESGFIKSYGVKTTDDSWADPPTKASCELKGGNWCPAAPFVCSQPASCLILDNEFGILESKVISEADCVATDKTVVKWCPFETDAPTAVPAAAPTAAPESCELGACAARLFEKRGCTYPEATNYDEEATFDDKSCDFRARLEPVLVQGSFCIAGLDVSSSSSIENMVQVLVQVVTGLTEGASFSFDVSTADSCGPGGTTRRLQESAPVVVAGYSIGVKSQNVAEASAIANILNDSRQLTTQMHELNSEANIQRADAVVVADTLAPTPGPTPGPTPAHTPCRPCMAQSDCDGSEICEFPSARRGLRFGSIQQEGCCHAR